MPKRKAREPTGFEGVRGFRDKAEAASSSTRRTVSSLARQLLYAWSWGEISARTVQELAEAALNDGCAMDEIKTLAGLGARGSQPGNIHRDLEAQLCSTDFGQAVSTLPLELKIGPMHFASLHLPFLWPHAMFATLFHKYPAAFRERLCGGDPANTEVFWTALEGTTRYQQHWVKDKVDHKKLCVPLSLHGDGIPIAHAGRAAAQSVEASPFHPLPLPISCTICLSPDPHDHACPPRIPIVPAGRPAAQSFPVSVLHPLPLPISCTIRLAPEPT